jgi:fatty-acid desaturase
MAIINQHTHTRGTKMYNYKQVTKKIWSVGYLDESGKWVNESQHNDPSLAAARTAWLNGTTAAQAEELISDTPAPAPKKTTKK